MTNVSLALPLADEKLATALTEELQHVEEHLRSATSHADTVVNEASQHLANAGGNACGRYSPSLLRTWGKA